MPTTALYHWRVAGTPVEILIDLGLVDRMRIASVASTDEVGGILLGYYEGNYTVINDFELVESEHRRGAAYTLSQRDEAKLGSRLEAKRKRGASVPVGFFRTHLRPGMFLDEGDNHVLSAFFNNANQVALLIKPAADRSATGGFFFWEEGDMNRKQSYLSFPMSSRELESGEFPLVEPVAESPAAAEATAAEVTNVTRVAMEADPDDSFAFSSAPEVDTAEAYAEPVRSTPAAVRATGETRIRERTPLAAKLAANRNLPWQLIGLVAALAAFGGYLIGTSGSHRDRFGARSGDITLNSSPSETSETSNLPPAPTAQPSASSPGAPQAGADTATTPTANADAPSASPVAEARPPEPKDQGDSGKAPAENPRVPVNTPTANRERLTPKVAAALAQGNAATRGTNSSVVSGPASEPDNSANWQHFHKDGTPPPAQTAVTQPAPEPNPAPSVPVERPAATHAAPVALSSVYLEAVESNGVGKAFGKIPLFGAFHRSRSGESFTPPQAVRSAAPKVPTELARELTGTLPVDLRLKVDASGRVSSVEILSRQSPAEFVRLAGDAAYDWQFEPARVKDKVVSSNVIAHFKFRPSL